MFYESIRPSLRMRGKNGHTCIFCMSRSRVFFHFSEIGLLRRHIKRDHLNKWSPWEKYMRANTMNIEIPEEKSLFAELKTLTENVPLKMLSRLMEGRRLEAHCSVKEQRSLVKRHAKKAATSWRRRSKTRRGGSGRDGPGASEVSAQLEARLRDFESSTYLHSVPTRRERHRERDAKRRQFLQRNGWKSSQTRKEEVHTSGSSTRC